MKCQAYRESTHETDVINLNKYQIVTAEDRMISLTGKNLQKAICYTDALEQREKLQTQHKVDSSYDGFGTFFALHTQRMPYVFELSFCARPKLIKRVPKECRDLYPRTYREEAWHKLLFQEYRLPESLKEEHKIDAQTAKEWKKGYSSMRAYLEDYWEVPAKNRTITPTMMRGIKLVERPFSKLQIGSNLEVPLDTNLPFVVLKSG